MATRTVGKAGARASATARTKRHAQRTPLPGDTSRPVKGNPTAEAIKDELSNATRKPRVKKGTVSVGQPCPNHCGNTLRQSGGAGAYKCSKCGRSEAPTAVRRRKASAPAPKPQHDARTFGEQTEPLAAQVKEMRDGGATWISIATTLGLSEGKTGCSQARRLYRSTNGGQSAPRATRARKQKEPRTVRVVAEDGTVTREPVVGDGGVPMLKMVPAFHFRAVDERRLRKEERRMGMVNTFPATEQQVRSLTAIFGADGYTVQVVRHEPDSACCAAPAAIKATPRPKRRAS